MKPVTELQPDRRGALILIVALALAARAGVALLTKSWIFLSDDSFRAFGYEMSQIAASLATGQGFSWPAGIDWFPYRPGPTAWMPPLYPFIIAIAFKGFGVFSVESALVLEFFQTIASVLTCVLLYSVGKRIYGVRAGLLAALMLALYPASIHFAVQKIWSTSLFAASPLILILMTMWSANRPGASTGLVVGCTFGLAALLDPIVLTALPFALAWLYREAGQDRSKMIATVGAILIAALLVISPWILRNYALFGRFTLIKSNFGNELFLGNNEYSVGDHRDVVVPLRNLDEILSEAEMEFIRKSNEVIRSDFLLGKAVDHIVAHPLRFSQLTLNRVLHYWTFPNPPGGVFEKLSLVCYFMLLVLSALGFAQSDLRSSHVQLALLFLLSLPLPYYFTVIAHFRYRFPIEPILMVFAAQAVDRFVVRVPRLSSLVRAWPLSSPGVGTM